MTRVWLILKYKFSRFNNDVFGNPLVRDVILVVPTVSISHATSNSGSSCANYNDKQGTNIICNSQNGHHKFV